MIGSPAYIVIVLSGSIINSLVPISFCNLPFHKFRAKCLEQ